MQAVLTWVVIGASLLLAASGAPQRRRRTAPPTYDAGVVHDSPTGDAPVDLTRATDAELFRAWRVSQFRVQREALMPYYDRAMFARLLSTRELLLDELERRHPQGFTSWMSAWPAAVVDPGTFLASHGQRRPRR